MKMSAAAFLIFLGAIATATAAPSFLILAPPVTASGNTNTGPAGIDPTSRYGQHIFAFANQADEALSFEFYDNIQTNGGGTANASAICGQVANLSTNANGDIVAFDVQATITNDTSPVTTNNWQFAANSHGESLSNPAPQSTWDAYAGEMKDTWLTAEFAIQAGLPPPNANPPFDDLGGLLPRIVALNHDGLAWYCFNDAQGAYYVPSWHFGDIPLPGSAARLMRFAVQPPMSNTDPRYSALIQAASGGNDIFANRTMSLKVSQWLDMLRLDDGSAYPVPPNLSSDVSVFHDPSEGQKWGDYDGDGQKDPEEPGLPGVGVYLDLDGSRSWEEGEPKTVTDEEGYFRFAQLVGVTSTNYWLREIPLPGWVQTYPGSPDQGHLVTVLESGDVTWPPEETPDFGNEPIGDETLDFGDAQDPTFPTLAANNGAAHVIVPGVRLGASIDGEPDGQPDPNALGDDNDIVYPPPNDDEDGVIFPALPLAQGTSAPVQVTASVNGYLSAWIDFNADGDWNDAGEQIFFDRWLFAGTNNISFNVPVGLPAGASVFARFRFSTQRIGASYTGLWSDGEVEDYVVTIGDAPSGTLDWGDAADPKFPTWSSNSGPSHVIVSNIFLGQWVEPDPDGQPTALADGDDNGDGTDDEDGVVFPFGALRPGQLSQVDITASTNGLLSAWIDFNADGDWNDPGEQVFNDQALGPGLNSLLVNVPATTPTLRWVMARFRFSTQSIGTSYTGQKPDGEVEDYWLSTASDEPEQNIDWGDALDPTFPTLARNNGAAHVIVSNLFLGASIDGEPDGQPDPAALGDDNDIVYPPPNDDEDGVTFPPGGLTTGTTNGVLVVASAPGWLSAWVDFTGDGDWNDAGEQIFWDRPLATGANVLTFPVPSTANPGTQAFARFRFSTARIGAAYVGLWPNGEVEDYLVTIAAPQPYDYGDAPESGTAFPTTSTNNGAAHLVAAGVSLGLLVEGDPDGQPTPLADGDDVSDGTPDEDGVLLASGLLLPGVTNTVPIAASTNGFLSVWIDFYGDLDWNDPGENVALDAPIGAGTNNLPLFVPPTGLPSGTPIYARLRFSVQPLTGQVSPPEYAGLAATVPGEVEDYVVPIGEEGESYFDWGDAPESGTLFPTTGTNNGAVHLVIPGVFLGQQVDLEADGQPTPAADGDDNNPAIGPDDEDGVTLVAGRIYAVANPGWNSVNVVASATGFICAWIDFNNDLDWNDTGELILANAAVVPGTNNLTFNVPLGGIALGTNVVARFRYTTAPMLPPTYAGYAPSGEVEDHLFAIDSQPAGANATIQGIKFHDLGGDGAFNGTDTTLSGWDIYLDLNGNAALDAGEPRTMTDAAGAYAFSVPAPFTYTVREILWPAWTQTYPTNIIGPDYHVVAVTPASTNIADFGNWVTEWGTVTGVKFYDQDQNRAKGSGETGLRDWLIFADLNTNSVRDVGEPADYTDTWGRYALPLYWMGGSPYQIREVIQPPWTQTLPGSPTYAHSVSISPAGTTVSNMNFGNWISPSADTDGDGQTDLQEYFFGTLYNDCDSLYRTTGPIIDKVGGTATCQFYGKAGRTYQMQQSSDLGKNDPWTDIAGACTTCTVNDVLLSISTSWSGVTNRMFYRIIVKY